jgi:ABC-type spermidine/putrescine transport system permease subunit I
VTDPTQELASRRPRRRHGSGEAGVWYPRGFWAAFATPATLWLLVPFVLPFYAILSVAFGTVDPVFRTAVPQWNPLQWHFSQMSFVLEQTFLREGIFQPALIRTLEYVAAALVLCLAIGYPVAYFIARYGGRHKAALLMLLIAPFWISYLMRMLAWVNLLQDNGLVNKGLMFFHLTGDPVPWLQGRGSTVVLGLVYGYIPYMILPLYGALDRIDPALLEAARDLGASPAGAFRRVTLPLSKQAILAGSVIVTLPMFGDYYTNDLLSGSPKTAMLGTLIDRAVNSPLVTQAAAFVVVMMGLLIIPMLYYLYATARAARMA